MMGGKYKVRIWCPDCIGEAIGCFGGSDYFLSEQEFNSLEEAKEYGDSETEGTIWRYEVRGV